jgi:hypothetical protein
MKESTKTAPAEILYDAREQLVTVRVKDGGAITLPIQDALWLGQQLYNLLNPIEYRVKRTSKFKSVTSAFDPNRTSV